MSVCCVWARPASTRRHARRARPARARARPAAPSCRRRRWCSRPRARPRPCPSSAAAARCGRGRAPPQGVHRRHADRVDDHVRGRVVGDREHEQVEVGQAGGRRRVQALEQSAAARAGVSATRTRLAGSSSPRSAALQNAAETSTLIVLAAGRTARRCARTGGRCPIDRRDRDHVERASPRRRTPGGRCARAPSARPGAPRRRPCRARSRRARSGRRQPRWRCGRRSRAGRRAGPARSETSRPASSCWAALCGSSMPKRRCTACTRPEQSRPSTVTPPHS